MGVSWKSLVLLLTLTKNNNRSLSIQHGLVHLRRWSGYSTHLHALKCAYCKVFFCLLRFPGYLQELHSNDWKQIDQTQQHFKIQTCMRQTVGYILGLQPREKAAMLGVNTREFFWNMKREFSFQRREMLLFLTTTMTAVIDVTCKPSIGKCSHSIFLIVTWLSWLRGFLVIFQYLVWFSICFFLWELREIGVVKILQFCP